MELSGSRSEMLFKIVRMLPITILTLSGLLLSWIADRLGVLYDSGGLGSLLFYIGWLLQFLVGLAHDALRQFELSRQVDLILSIATGLFLALSLDFGLSKIRGRRTVG